MRKIVDTLPPQKTIETANSNAPQPGVKETAWQPPARSIVHRGFSALQYGSLTWRDRQEEHRFGPVEQRPHPLGPLRPVVVEPLDPRLYSELLLGGSMAAAETFMRGMWRTDDLPAMLQTMLRNQAITDEWDGDESFLRRITRRVGHAMRGNSIKNSRKNIAAHYDLGNDFYELWLDETMAYSSAIFESPELSLAEAQRAKFDRLCRKLDLRPHDHLLEIGTGWGGLAIHAARNYGCRVTTTTISQAQFEFATARVAEAGLSERVTVLCRDYRALEGSFDKLVSVEMLEAVGYRYFDVFFRKCGQLLVPGGKFALQTITIADQRFETYRRSVDFIQKYVFPGGCLPSLTALTASLTRSSRLRVTAYEDLGSHYATTLSLWRTRFFEKLDAVRALGYPEPFIRLWDYYLSYCEAGFRERASGLAQMTIE